ncbi:MAG: hypothetical protein AAGG79_05645 [Pseudomonadota bacterium]
MFVTFLDQLWVRLGLQREELRQERGRGFIYAILIVTGAASVFLATDLLLNFTGRAG